MTAPDERDAAAAAGEGTASAPFLSICITSYNRPNELKRCLLSIDSRRPGEIEILVSEDKSPAREAIAAVVEVWRAGSDYRVRFNANPENLGYDRNLGKLIQLARGKYVLFMSDDDAFVPGAIDRMLDALADGGCAIAISPYFMEPTGSVERAFGPSRAFPPDLARMGRQLYFAILFSGLIFERSKIAGYDSERFKDTLYFQVYLFASVASRHGWCHFDIPLVQAIADGVNAFGTNESSPPNPLLADRSSVHSHLEFHKGLIAAIRLFDRDNGTRVIDGFAREYSLRSFGNMSLARALGRDDFEAYWRKMNALDLKLRWPAFFYYFALRLLGHRVCEGLMKLPRLALLKRRTRR